MSYLRLIKLGSHRALRQMRNTTFRYENVKTEKSSGAIYTPPLLAGFVAEQMIKYAPKMVDEIHLFDPAVGDGELLLSMLKRMDTNNKRIKIFGFDTNALALEIAHKRIAALYPDIKKVLKAGDFLEFIYQRFISNDHVNLAAFNEFPDCFDLIIANPPYVRTQILGKEYSKRMSDQFGLKGRIDLAYAFILGILKVTKTSGTLGLIVSNRLMSVKAGACIREKMYTSLDLKHIYDLGDTKIFDAAVLPAVIIANGKNSQHLNEEVIAFTTIYSKRYSRQGEAKEAVVSDPISALKTQGIVTLHDGRSFEVRHGFLKRACAPSDIWTLSNQEEYQLDVDGRKIYMGYL